MRREKTRAQDGNFEVIAEKVRETEKAILVKCPSDEEGYDEQWLPKSQIEVEKVEKPVTDNDGLFSSGETYSPEDYDLLRITGENWLTVNDNTVNNIRKFIFFKVVN